MKEFLIRLLMYPLCIFLLAMNIYFLITTPFNFRLKGGSIMLVVVVLVVLVYLVTDIILLFIKKDNKKPK